VPCVRAPRHSESKRGSPLARVRALELRSWPVALAMTLALLMFIYGMGRYFKRIYQRFALDSDSYITGEG